MQIEFQRMLMDTNPMAPGLGFTPGLGFNPTAAARCGMFPGAGYGMDPTMGMGMNTLSDRPGHQVVSEKPMNPSSRVYYTRG